MPPPYLLTLVIGSPNERWFSEHGRREADWIEGLASTQGKRLSSGLRVLDYGCGCGRLARWLAPKVEESGGAFTGIDIQPPLIAWCAANLPGRYTLARLRRAIPVEAGSVDLIYALSVVTHLKRASTEALVAEFARVLAPGGVALLTFQDEHFNGDGREAEIQRRGYVVSTGHREGSNHMSAWATHEAFAALCAKRLEVVRTIPSVWAEGYQALCVLRRPA